MGSFLSKEKQDVRKCHICKNEFDIHVTREKVGKEYIYYCSYVCYQKR